MPVAGRGDRATNVTLEIVGREEELASLHAFIAEAEGGPAALVLEGEAGIGKSTLWLAGVEHARARDCASSPRDRPRPSAVSLTSGSAICSRTSSTRCCRRCRRRGGARSRSRCCSRRRRAIRSIPARSASRCATRCSCSRERGPVLVAIDDVQWFDASSASALAFALRRLAREPRAPAARPAARRRSGSRRARAGARRGARPAVAGGAAQRRRAPSAPARPARQAVRAPDVAPHPRAVGRQSVLRARAGPRARRRRRPRSAAPVPETLEELVRARISGLPASDARGARARLGVGHDVGVAAGAGGRCRRCARRRPSPRT